MVLNSGISWNMTYTTINGTKKMYPHLLYLTAFPTLFFITPVPPLSRYIHKS